MSIITIGIDLAKNIYAVSLPILSVTQDFSPSSHGCSS